MKLTTYILINNVQLKDAMNVDNKINQSYTCGIDCHPLFNRGFLQFRSRF